MDLPQTPASRAIAAQKIKYLQSTPAQSTTSKIQQRSTVSASAIFGDCPFSPIVPISQNKEDDAIFQNTPVIASGRARPIIDMATEDDEYEVMDEREKRRRFRAISPPKSPTRIDASTETPPVLTMDEIFAHVSLGQITEEEKNMTVENYLRHIVDTNIDKVRKHGDTLIDMIQAKSDRIKSQLLQQQQEK